MAFLTTEELRLTLASYRDSLQRLQEQEPTWNKAERKRGLNTIAQVRQHIIDAEAELAMARGNKHAAH